MAFINPVLMTKGYLNDHQLMIVEALLMLIGIITLPLAGKLADRKSTTKVMCLSCFLLIVFSFPLLWVIDQSNLIGIIIAQALFIIINEILLGPSNAYLKSIFPMHYRYRASSFSFCLGMSLLGGLTPLMEIYLYEQTGQFTSASLWLIFTGLGTLVSLTLVHYKYKLTTTSQVSS